MPKVKSLKNQEILYRRSSLKVKIRHAACLAAIEDQEGHKVSKKWKTRSKRRKAGL
jgi:hypothetical protein